MKTYKFALLFFTISLLFSVSAFSWDSTGHRLIAVIAYQHLTPKARAAVDRLTYPGDEKYKPPLRFLYASVWPDLLKSRDDVTAFNSWHFISSPFSPDGTPLPPLPKENVVWAIGQMEHVLESSKPNTHERTVALRFLLHFVGDVHQPLHASTRVTKRNPEGDRGGNFYPIRNRYVKNLHAYWDQGVGFFREGQKRYPLRYKQVKRLAAKIEADYPEASFGSKVTDLDPAHWADESFQIAKGFVYSTPERATPDQAYRQKGRAIVEQRIALAGYRLASLLNGIYSRA